VDREEFPRHARFKTEVSVWTGRPVWIGAGKRHVVDQVALQRVLLSPASDGAIQDRVDLERVSPGTAEQVERAGCQDPEIIGAAPTLQVDEPSEVQSGRAVEVCRRAVQGPRA